MSIKQRRDIKRLTLHHQSLTHSWSPAKTVVRKAQRSMLLMIQNSGRQPVRSRNRPLCQLSPPTLPCKMLSYRWGCGWCPLMAVESVISADGSCGALLASKSPRYTRLMFMCLHKPLRAPVP